MIKLVANGREFSGWMTLKVGRSLSEVSGSFEFTLAEIPDLKKATIATQDEIQVFLNEKLLMTGFVDSVSASFSANNREFVIRGRDKTADLIDSSFDGPEQFTNIDLKSLVQNLIKPFGISLKIDPGVFIGPRFEQVSIERGASVWESIEKYTRNRGVLVTTSPEGDLVLTKPGLKTAEINLIEGENVQSGTATRDFTNRFKEYEVNTSAPIFEALIGTNAIKAFAKDPEVKRNRKFIFVTEGTSDQIRDRVQWEAINRAARSISLEVQVPSWTTFINYWEINSLVDVFLPTVGINETLLIDRVEFSLDNGGEMTSLSLTRQDAYQIKPEIPIEFEGIFLGETD